MSLTAHIDTKFIALGTKVSPVPTNAPYATIEAANIGSANASMRKISVPRRIISASGVITPIITGAARYIINKLNNAQLELVAKQRESELKNLKSQLNPHFLFNTLNNIYALIAISPVKAQAAVHELGNLLRYVLYENKEQEVELSKEIDFIENYISLMRLRLSPDVVLNVNIVRKETENNKIEPLMFVSLVENAFKHGISNSKPSYISISLLSDNQKVMCSIENSNFPKPKTDKSGSGIGLKNLQKQLSILYPDCSDLSIQSDDNKFQSVLTIYYKKRQDNEKTQMLRD